jgi:tetratricopeptide (TPR) repeat protein
MAPYLAATRHMAATDFKTARTEILDAIKAEPGWFAPHLAQAQILAELGDGVGARAAIERALALGVKPVDVRHLQAHVLLLLGEPEKALAEASAADLPAKFRPYAVRVKARAFLAQGNLGASAQEYQTLVAATPKDSLAWSDFARLRVYAGDLSGAIQACRTAVELNPRNHDALTLMGELVRGQFGLVASIPWYERALEVEPGNTVTMLELAATYGDAGRARDMLAMTRRVLAIDEKNAKAFYLQAVLAARAGKYDLSRSLLNRVGDRLDDLAAVILLKAVLEIKAGNEELAIAQLRELLLSQPDNLKLRRLLGAIADRADADSYSLTLIGRAFEKLDDRKAAAVYLDRAAFPVPRDPVPFGSVDDIGLVERANADNPGNAKTAVPLISRLILAGRAADALPVAQTMQKQNPGVPAAHVLVGDALLALDRPKEAAAAYQLAADLQFSESSALRLIEALRRSGENARALQVLSLFIQQNPRNVPAQRLLGDHFLATQDWTRAIDVLELVRRRIGNRDASLLNSLAWAWLGKGDQERALIFAKAAYDLSPANPATANTYGWFLVKSKQDARTGTLLLEKSVASQPGHPGLRFQLAQGYAAIGQKAKAKVEVQKALSNPEFSDADKAKELLATL